jgi:hypothetical protein
MRIGDGRRPGKILVLFSLMLPLMLGLVGLTIDSGLLMASHRQTQNAADAAAMTAAMELFRGSNAETALAQANDLLARNDLADVALALNGGVVNTLNIPPRTGPYAGDARFVEAVVEWRTPTSFIHVLGVNQDQRVVARAVAGYEPVASGEGAIVLDPRTPPKGGISINGQNTMLKVNGTVVVNAAGAGMNEFGDDVNGSEAITTTATPSIVAQEIQAVGGIDILDRIRRYDPAYAPDHYNINDPDRPFFRLNRPVDDPLWDLPVPTTSNGVQERYWTQNSDGTLSSTTTKTNSLSRVSIGNGDVVTLWPGIYHSISITGGTVTFEPGIYVVGVDMAAGGGTRFNINGGTVTGSGVMIYNTGSNYKPDGSNDAGLGENTDPSNVNRPPSRVTGADGTTANFGGMTVNGGSVTLTPYNDTTNTANPFNGVLLYQRRWNESEASVGGNSNDINLTGTIYAKWAKFGLAGQGRYNAQYIVGSLSISGNALVTINATGRNFGKANQIFLVE